MKTSELKKNFHLLIDNIENENLLINFYDIIKRRSSAKDGQLWVKLTEEEKEELLLSLEESENPDKEKGIRGFTIVKQITVFYKVDQDKIILLNFFDNRLNPQKRRF
jgi:hypothetical protein